MSDRPDPSEVPTNLLAHLSEVLPVVRTRRLGLLVDFDGTIAEIAPTPDEAVISWGCARALERLSRRLALVSVVSGRAADDVGAKVELDRVVYVGNHGAEYLVDGQLDVAPGAAEYRERIGSVFRQVRAAADGPGLVWQDKGLSASVHYRLAPDSSEAERRLREALRSTPGVGEVEVFWGKLVLELRAPIGLTKGYALRRLVRDRDLTGVIFIGDDTTDADGLLALKELAAGGGLRGLGVAVLHDDSPRELMAAADYALDGVPEVERFLTWLDSNVG